MKKNLVLVLLFFGVYAYSQNPPCKANVVMNNLYNQYPEMKTHSDFINTQIEKERAQQRNYSIPAPGSITIPTVVYVVHNGTTATNITDSQVQQQLVALNQKFNNTGIKFCLGGSGNNVNVPMKTTSEVQTTKGIIHIQNSGLINHSSTNSQVLFNTAHSSVTPDKYMRIWVVNSIDGLNSGILGYAYYPGGNSYDGIVVRNNVFGNGTSNLLTNYNQGETLVHEVGHYLGLRHTFEGGCESPNNNPLLDNDFVADTPKVSAPNFYCVIGTNSCTEFPASNDLIRNYMDYGDNICTDSFTDGQKQRMIDQIFYFRENLVSKENIIATGTCGYNNLLSAKITANKYTVCANNPAGISFSALSAQSWSWNFGDGTAISTLQNPTHTYTSATNSPYTVTLTVTGMDAGVLQTLVSTTQIFVSDCSNFAPNSDTYWPINLSNGLNFSLGVPEYDINFPNNIPVTIDVTSQCDNSGNLLFYTSNNRLYNKQHQLITSNLLTGQDVTPLIVQNPANPNQYYYFTSSLTSLGITLNYGLRYSIIENNSGTITLNSLNVTVTTPAGYSTGIDNAVIGSRGITAVKKCNGDYWIITTLCKDAHSHIVVYSLSANGLTFHDDNNFDLGFDISSDYTPTCNSGFRVVASPNGNKLFCKQTVFDFDKFSGEISNPIILSQIIDGATFSPDSNFLYTIETQNNNIYPYYIIQHNLNTSNLKGNPIITFYKDGIVNRIRLQNGPDSKIYIASDQYAYEKRLGVIHKPNVLSTQNNSNACMLFHNGPKSLNNPLSKPNSLPNLINAKQESTYPIDPSKKISKYLIGCNRYKFFPNVCSTSFKWEFINTSNNNNTVTINETTPEYEFVTNGNYTIKLKNANNDELATTSLTVSTPVVTIVGSSSACTEENSQTNNSVILTNGQTVVWTIPANQGTITGQNTNPSVDVNWTFLPGQLTATVTDSSGCLSVATKTITSVCCQECLDSVFWQSVSIPGSPGQYNSCVLPTSNPSCNGLNMRYTWAHYDHSYQTTTTNCVGPFPTNQTPDGVKIDILDTGSNVLCSTNFGIGFARHSNSSKTNKTIYDVAISPNPSSGIFSIKINDFEGNIKLSVFDINGRLIFSETDKNFNQERNIDLSNIQSGIYLLKIENEYINYSQKIIKN